MRQDFYTLPEVNFVSGQSVPFRWRLLKEAKVPFNGEGCTGNFAVVNYSDKNGEPIISKSLTFSVGDDDVKNIISVELEPNDTIGLSGKFIYQITLRDVDGEVEIPNLGILHIAHNINESFLTQ